MMNRDYCEHEIYVRRHAAGLWEGVPALAAICQVLQQIIKEYLDQDQVDSAAEFLLQYNSGNVWRDHGGYPGMYSWLKTVSKIYESRGEVSKLKAIWKRAYSLRKADFYFFCPLPGDNRPRAKEFLLLKQDVQLAGNEYVNVLERYGTPEEITQVREELTAVEAERRRKRKFKPDPRKIDENVFWELIEECRKEPDIVEYLIGRLESLKTREIINYKKFETRLMRQAYRWELWAVAFIMMSGCGDDSFEYFRAWLISRGRAHFEAALKDPQKAAEGVEPGDICENEAFLSVAESAYTSIAKDGGADFWEKVTPKTEAKIQGQEWEEKDLPRMYPDLCKRFGYKIE